MRNRSKPWACLAALDIGEAVTVVCDRYRHPGHTQHRHIVDRRHRGAPVDGPRASVEWTDEVPRATADDPTIEVRR